MKVESQYDCLIRALRDRIKMRGHGSMKDMANSLGFDRNYLYKVTSRRSLDIVRLLQMLDYLGITLADLAEEAGFERTPDLPVTRLEPKAAEVIEAVRQREVEMVGEMG